jgi:hypothetical protein
MKRGQYLSCRGHSNANVSESISELTNAPGRDLREFTLPYSVTGMEDVVVHMAPVNREHLPRHALVALHTAFTMVQKRLANFFYRHLVCVRSIGAIGNLALDLNAELVRRLTGLKLWSVTFPSGV